MTVIINGSTGIDTVQDGIVTDAKLSLTANSQEIKDAINATGSAPIYACRAWVNFNGTGTVAIRESGNVSSITDNGTGNYQVNFTTSLSDTNYCVVSAAEGNSIDSARLSCCPTRNTGSCVIRTVNGTNTAVEDQQNLYVSVFR